MHPKGADSVAISGISFGNTLVGSGWATAVLCMNGFRKQSPHLARHPFPMWPISSMLIVVRDCYHGINIHVAVFHPEGEAPNRCQSNS